MAKIASLVADIFYFGRTGNFVKVRCLNWDLDPTGQTPPDVSQFGTHLVGGGRNPI